MLSRIKPMLVGLLLCMPMLASAWWNADWAYRKKITLDGAETPALGAQVQQVMVPLRLHAGNFAFTDAQEAGNDLRFVASDDKTPLNFHIEQFDGVNEVAVVWVQAPSVGAKDSSVWMYFGNTKAQPSGSPKASFDPHTVAAFHFAERQGTPRDSTGYGNNASLSDAKLGSAGVSGFGAGLTGSNSMRMPGAPSLSTPPGTGWTVSMWVRAAGAGATGSLVTRDEAGKRLVLGLDGGKPYLSVVDGSQTGRLLADKPVDGGSWHHIAFTLGDRAALYVDGNEVAKAATHLPEFKGDILIGAANGAGGLVGDIDELQISNLMRPPEWLRAAAIAQLPETKLVKYGGDEGGSSNDEYFQVLRLLANAVSTDGWVIVGVTLLLGLVSTEVMFVKLALLRRMQKQNLLFLGRFREVGSAMARMKQPAQAEAHVIADSPLFRVYQAGLNELANVRAGGFTGALTPQALEVVRSGIDSGIVAEARRMNDRLVLLTLSVSAAPFLGLLGTVVGIMITFGSIALAGDVNVNTIAPGVAAALVATVAGLAVAIPAMFGYNYLATRIKDITSDMEVFANELLGKLALRYATDEAAKAADADSAGDASTQATPVEPRLQAKAA